MKEKTAQKILNESIAGYEKIAEHFSQTRPYFWKEFDFVKDYVKENGSVLDIGCGNGRLFEFLKDKHISYAGIDTSPKLINIARQKYPYAKFIEANALELPFPDNSFDAVFSFAVLHHIPSKKFRKEFLKEISRVTAMEGFLILTVWNLWHKKYIFKILKSVLSFSGLDFKDLYMDFGTEKNVRYLHAFTKNELKNLVAKTGLSIKISKTVKRETGQSNFLIVAEKIDRRQFA